MKIADKVKKIIAEKLDVDVSDVVPEASLIDDLGADSLAIVELIMTMEEEFDIEVPDEDAERAFHCHKMPSITSSKIHKNTLNFENGTGIKRAILWKLQRQL